MKRWPVVVIGGGVIGCAVLWALARRGVAGLLLEAEADVCEGTSKANSGIIHTGFDATPGSLEAMLLRRAAETWPDVLDTLEVPHLRVGAIMAAHSTADLATLEGEYHVRARRLGVEVELLDRTETMRLAPYLASSTVGAMSIPGESVVDPFWLTRAFAAAAIEAGAQVKVREAVIGLQARDGEVVLTTPNTEFIAEQVVVAAGMASDQIARLVGDDSFELRPRKGAFLVSEDAYGVDRIVLPVPGPLGKGMLVTPIVFGGALLGPTAVDGIDRTDRTTTPSDRAVILDSVARLVPAMGSARPIRAFAGLRHVSSTGDYIIRPSTVSDRIHIVAGIRSTGVSSSHAIGDHVATEVAERRGWTLTAPRAIRPSSQFLPDDAGRIVCICRSISEAEVVSAIQGPIPPRTLDGVKRRCGVGFGDCQGNLCNVGVASILAQHAVVPIESIEKHIAGSWLFAKDATDRREPRSAEPIGTNALPGVQPVADVVVVGGGLAGRSAASATASRGLSTVIIERRAQSRLPNASLGVTDGSASAIYGATVIGLDRIAGRWSVSAQYPDGSIEFEARDVILATGAIYRPREARDIAGPRPAGVMTADQALEALAHRYLPGRDVIVVSPRVDAPLVTELRLAGANVRVASDVPEEIAGRDRLTAVRIGSDWLHADTLVLADILDPQAFLLRGLGLLDKGSGTRPPVDEDGRAGPDGLWAVGCCVAPDVSHRECRSSGERVGVAVATRHAGAR